MLIAKTISGQTVTVLLLMLLFAPVYVFADAPEKAPRSPAFENWLSSKNAGENFGYVPSPVDWSHLTVSPSKADPPAQYDLRTEGGLTSVKNQGICGSCWSHAACSALESWIRINTAEVLDLSENHMKNNHGFLLDHCDGGNNEMATAYLARWDGPLLESEDPYDPYSSVPLDPTPPPQKLLTAAPIFTYDGIDRTEVQNAIMTYGALSTMMYWGDPDYNSGDYTYYSTMPEWNENHMVVVVGWDDAKAVSGAPGPGAWICKNSWGTSWGEGGFFYISYYDTLAVRKCTAFIDLEAPGAYGNLYQHDPLGYTSSFGWEYVSYAANVFTAAADEAIVAVGTYATADNTAYEITVYDSGISGGSFYNPVTTVSGTFENAGYYLVDLPSAVNVTSGQQFSVTVRYQIPVTTVYPIPAEAPVDYAAPTATLGQSYVSSDGASFIDLAGQTANANVCIKAIAAAPDKTVRVIGPHWAEEGDPVTFTALLPALVGTVTYEWYKDDVLIIGADTDTYYIPAVTFGDAGMYKLIVTDESKEIMESAPFELVVLAEGSLPVSNTIALVFIALSLSAAGAYLLVQNNKRCTE